MLVEFDELWRFVVGCEKIFVVMDLKKCLELFIMVDDVVKGFYVFFDDDCVNVE